MTKGDPVQPNPYLPYPVRIDEITIETEDKNLKTFKFSFLDPADEEKFAYRPGQFAELSIAGKGEIPIGIASSPTEKGFVKFTVNKVGLVIIGGGFAFTTLRSSIIYMLANRERFGDIHVIYGARTPGMLLYRQELAAWEARDDIHMHITVDATQDPSWKYNVGFVPTFTAQQAPAADENTYAIICGPPIMIKFTQPVLDARGYAHDHIVMSLENRMKCGIGMCSHCNVGQYFVCKDGPVFTLAPLTAMPKEY